MIELNLNFFYCIGHRGNELFDPENSFPAFKRVAENYIDFIETDIQITKDNHFILFHDRFLNKKTNFRGLIKKYPLEELRKARYIYFEERLEPLCTLEELFDYISRVQKPRPNLILELKSRLKKEHFIKLIDLIKKYNLIDNIIIDSFYLENLKKLRKISKDIFISLLLKKIPKIKNLRSDLKYFKKIYRMLNIYEIQAVSIHRDNLFPSIIEFFKEKGLFVFAWGVKNKKDYHKFVSMKGLNGFTAPDPIEQKRIRKNLLNY